MRTITFLLLLLTGLALALPGILVIHPLRSADLCGQAGSWRIMELFHGFIYAHHRSLGIIRALVDVKDVFHLGDIPSTGLSDAPHLYFPGLEIVFFRHSNTATLEI